jgi:hypothetical protein
MLRAAQKVARLALMERQLLEELQVHHRRTHKGGINSGTD